METEGLGAVERELLQRCIFAGGETTTTLDAEMTASPGRPVLEKLLKGLVELELMERMWGMDASLTTDRRRGEISHRVYEDDCWRTTDAGRSVVGLPPAGEGREQLWINPSSGPHRVPPMLARWSAWRSRRGKSTLPAWYARLTGTRAWRRDGP